MLPKWRNESAAAGALALALLFGATGRAQPADDLKAVLERLDRLEQQNRELLEQVRALRDELEASRAGRRPAQQTEVEERLDVQETRTKDLAQSKVEASRHVPLRITGMALFNAYFNSASVGLQDPILALPGAGNSGATLRQTVLGFDYTGPRSFAGGQVRGSLFLDLWGGSGGSLDQLLRLRTATIGIDWKTRSIEVGQQKPLISPRDPDSLAQVAFSPLTGAGNLWLWSPQVRLEQRFKLSSQTEVRAQVAAIQTSESAPAPTPEYGAIPANIANAIAPRRPGIEARIELRTGGEDRRLELAPGFHHSVSHVAGTSVPSNIYSVDWLARIIPALEFTGALASGENFAPLGSGGLSGFGILPGGIVPVHSRSGWGQLAIRVAPRLTVHLFGGEQANRDADMQDGQILRNVQWGGNLFYRLAPNVILGVEAAQVRTTIDEAGIRRNNHYDLALAYLF